MDDPLVSAPPADPQPPSRGGGPARLWPLAVVAGVIAAAGLALLQLSRRQVPLAVGMISWPGYEYLYLAEQKGLDRPFGLQLSVRQYSSLVDQRRAFERGDVPVMATTIPEAIAVCQELPRRCPQLFLVLDESAGADRIIARADIPSPAGLIGRRIGLERTVLGEYLLLRSFGERQPELRRDLQLRFDGPVALVQALREGELDAIVTYSPFDAPLLDDSRYRVLFSSRQIPGEVVDVLAVDPAYARRHGRELKALVHIWWSARDHARRFPTEARALMAQRQQLDPGEFEATERGLNYPGPDQQARLLAAAGPLARSMARIAGQMQQAGLISPGVPMPSLSLDHLEAP